LRLLGFFVSFAGGNDEGRDIRRRAGRSCSQRAPQKTPVCSSPRTPKQPSFLTRALSVKLHSLNPKQGRQTPLHCSSPPLGRFALTTSVITNLRRPQLSSFATARCSPLARASGRGATPTSSWATARMTGRAGALWRSRAPRARAPGRRRRRPSRRSRRRRRRHGHKEEEEEEEEEDEALSPRPPPPLLLPLGATGSRRRRPPRSRRPSPRRPRTLATRRKGAPRSMMSSSRSRSATAPARRRRGGGGGGWGGDS
jgi:hypothetical protein